jgi:hypothetical protein
MSKLRAILTVAGVVITLAVVSPPAQAQNYTIDGRYASYGEALYLASQGMPPGAFWGDGFGNIPPGTPGYNRGTLGGGMMGNGRCAFAAEVTVGNCN